MSSLKLGDWVVEIPGYSPEVGDVGATTLFGDIYTTGVMPDGREWLLSNLRRDDYGMIVPTDTAAEILAYGRGYLPSEFLAWTDLPDGWHVPTDAEWSTLFLSIGATYLDADGGRWASAGTLLKEAGTAHWAYTTIPGKDNFGFAVTGSGYWIGPPYYPDWQRKSRAGLASTTIINSKLINFQFISSTSSLSLVQSARRVHDSLTPSVPLRYGVRLVRDVTPTPPTYRSGTHDLLILPSGLAETTESLAQRVDIRLRTFIGEHWLNPELGVPWFEEFLRKAPDLVACRQILVAVLQDVPGVVSVDSLTVTLDKSPRQMRVSFVVSGTDSIPQSGTTAVIL